MRPVIPSPLLRVHHRRFMTTKGPSTPVPRVGTTGPHIPCQYLCCAHAVHMPDGDQITARLITHRLESEFLTSSCSFRHRIHSSLRSSSQHTHDAFDSAFSLTPPLTVAAEGSLKAASRHRLSGAEPHLSHSCVFRSERSWIGIEVRSVFRIYSINRDALTFSTAF
jgi:hypothetical protein